MPNRGFVLVEVGRRRRGRPDHRRRVTIDLVDGSRLTFSSASCPAVIEAVVLAVLRSRRSRC